MTGGIVSISATIDSRRQPLAKAGRDWTADDIKEPVRAYHKRAM
jgi:hypothetical protein